MRALKRFLPTPEQLAGSRALSWLAPAFADRRLWAFKRRGVALGLAIGVFFGFLIPVAQILVAVAVAVAVRANVAVAAATTLVTNPFTFGPIYYLAYKVGAALLGAEAPLDAAALGAEVDGARAWLAQWWDRFAAVGKPLALGLGVFAVAGSVAGYAAVHLVWRVRVLRRVARRRDAQGAVARPPARL
jgi:uncharacterized protein (DUF2062 family)